MVKEIMRVEEFAKLVGEHPDTVRRKCRDGQIAAKKCGNRWYVRAREALGMDEGRKDGR